MKPRCRDCKYWMVRSGCVNAEKHIELGAKNAIAIIPSKYEVYKHINCKFFERRHNG